MIPITLIGNLTHDPEMRFTPSGAAVTNITIAVSKRVKDQDGTWKDGPASFVRCSIWRQYAENVAESLTKGDRVIATGHMHQREYETKEGERKSIWECEIEDIGPALRYSTARPVKVERSNTQGDPVAGAQKVRNALHNDPWQTPQPDVAPF
jgi:single-strand DNA-binding protein